jgi:hypothetical protein
MPLNAIYQIIRKLSCCQLGDMPVLALCDGSGSALGFGSGSSAAWQDLLAEKQRDTKKAVFSGERQQGASS